MLPFYLLEKCFLLFIECPLACISEGTLCSCFLFTSLRPFVILQTSAILPLRLKGLCNWSLYGSQSITFASLGILLCTFPRFTECLGVVDSDFLPQELVLGFRIQPILKGELIESSNSQELRSDCVLVLSLSYGSAQCSKQCSELPLLLTSSRCFTLSLFLPSFCLSLVRVSLFPWMHASSLAFCRSFHPTSSAPRPNITNSALKNKYLPSNSTSNASRSEPVYSTSLQLPSFYWSAPGPSLLPSYFSVSLFPVSQYLYSPLCYLLSLHPLPMLASLV